MPDKAHGRVVDHREVDRPAAIVPERAGAQHQAIERGREHQRAGPATLGHAVDGDADLGPADADGLDPAHQRPAQHREQRRGAGPAAGQAAGMDVAGAQMDAVIDAGGPEEHAALAGPRRVVVDLEHAAAHQVALDLARPPRRRAGAPACRRRGRPARHRRRSCWSCRAAAAPAAAGARTRRPGTARRARRAPGRRRCSGSGARIRAPRGRPARACRSMPGSKRICRMSRPAGEAGLDVGHAGAVALAQRVADDRDRRRVMPARPRRARIVSTRSRSAGLSTSIAASAIGIAIAATRSAEPPRDQRHRLRQRAQRAAGRPAAATGPNARASRQGCLRSRSMRAQNAMPARRSRRAQAEQVGAGIAAVAESQIGPPGVGIAGA